MNPRKTIYFFLCSTVIVQHQSCLAIPTNIKIRSDLHRRSTTAKVNGSTVSTVVSTTTTSQYDPNTEPEITAATITSQYEPNQTAKPYESTVEPTTIIPQYDLITEPEVVPTTIAPQYEFNTDVLRLSNVLESSEQEHGKVKRDTAPKHLTDPGRLSFRLDHRDDEELEVAETHLFRPLFKYQKLDSKRSHIRRQSTNSTTKRQT